MNWQFQDRIITILESELFRSDNVDFVSRISQDIVNSKPFLYHSGMWKLLSKLHFSTMKLISTSCFNLSGFYRIYTNWIFVVPCLKIKLCFLDCLQRDEYFLWSILKQGVGLINLDFPWSHHVLGIEIPETLPCKWNECVKHYGF